MATHRSTAVIGNRLLASVQPKDKPYEIRDSNLTGFILRVQPASSMKNGRPSMSYIVEYGRGKRMTIGRVGVLTPAEARDRAKQILADATKGVDPMAARKQARAHNFSTFIEERYKPWAESHLKTHKETMERLRRAFNPDFGKKKLAEITPWLMEKWRVARLKAGVKPVTVNRDLNTIKAALSKAVEWGLIDQHPLARFKLSRVDTSPKVRYLDEDEEKRLRGTLAAREDKARQQRDRYNQWREVRGYEPYPSLRKAAFTDHLRPMVLLAMNTGLRRGELLHLRWEDVDLNRASLTVVGATAKSGKTRHIPLNAEALDVLRKMHRPQNPAYVFGGADGEALTTIKTAWNKVLSDAGISQFRFHDLRHHFASRLVMAGVDLNTVRELLGHADIKMTLRYAHLAPKVKADAVAKLVRVA